MPSMPCVQEVERAYNAWFERANQFDGSIVLFYFCGHGVNWSDSRLPQISPRSPLDQCNQRANNHHESRPMVERSNQSLQRTGRRFLIVQGV